MTEPNLDKKVELERYCEWTTSRPTEWCSASVPVIWCWCRPVCSQAGMTVVVCLPPTCCAVAVPGHAVSAAHRAKDDRAQLMSFPASPHRSGLLYSGLFLWVNEQIIAYACVLAFFIVLRCSNGNFSSSETVHMLTWSCQCCNLNYWCSFRRLRPRHFDF